MAKYRAKQDVIPIKAGDVVEFNDPLLPELANSFELYDGEEETKDFVDELNDSTKSEGTVSVINPSREDLKKRAAELQLDYAPNITTPKLLELVSQAENGKSDAGDADKPDTKE